MVSVPYTQSECDIIKLDNYPITDLNIMNNFYKYIRHNEIRLNILIEVHLSVYTMKC